MSDWIQLGEDVLCQKFVCGGGVTLRLAAPTSADVGVGILNEEMDRIPHVAEIIAERDVLRAVVAELQTVAEAVIDEFCKDDEHASLVARAAVALLAGERI